jgi:predicted nucleic acid-binding protein
MILIETSAWIDYLRAAPTEARVAVRELLRSDADVRITEPIIMELIAGSKGKEAVIEQLVNGLPLVPLDAALDFRAAGELFRASRANGHPIRSLVDCLIAAIAIRHGATLLHKDRDFVFLAEISPLRLHPIPAG